MLEPEVFSSSTSAVPWRSWLDLIARVREEVQRDNLDIVAAGVTLLSAGLVAAFAPGDSLFVLILALALLGLGWNFGLISGTALIVDSTKPAARAKTQGTVDVLIALAGATGGGMSGLVVAGTSFAVLSLAGGVLSLLLVPVVIWFWRNEETVLS